VEKGLALGGFGVSIFGCSLIYITATQWLGVKLVRPIYGVGSMEHNVSKVTNILKRRKISVGGQRTGRSLANSKNND